MDNFGVRLKQLRKSKGFSQKELASLLGIGQTSIANYEKNIRFPSEDKLINLANTLDTSVDSLLGRTPTLELSFSVENKHLSDSRFSL